MSIRKELERLAERAKAAAERRDLGLAITGGLEIRDKRPGMSSYGNDHPELHKANATQPHPDDRSE